MTLTGKRIHIANASIVVHPCHSVPIDTFRNPVHLNSDSLTRRYLHKRDVLSTANTETNSTTEPFGSIQLTNVENDVLYSKFRFIFQV